MTPSIEALFDPGTSSLTYIVADRATRRAAIIDPVLDYDPKSGRTGTASADKAIERVAQQVLTVDWLLETHVHADHLSAAPYLKQRLGGSIAIGRHVTTVQRTFRSVFNAEAGFATDGSQFDRLLDDGDTVAIGTLEARVMHTPGHTPACVTYAVSDAAFVGDTLFMPDFGTARCDFPGGDAATLYRSIRRILSLPLQTRLFMCHDYMPGGRELRWETSVAEQREKNVHVHDGVTEAEFVRMRTERDKTLAMPVLLLSAVQVNMRAGAFPPPESNGKTYLKIPLNTF